MIQRIQTVYLLIAAFLVGSLFFVSYAEVVSSKGELLVLDAKGLYQESSSNPGIILSSLPIVVLCATSIALLLMTIFTYKKRMRQILISRISIVLLLGIIGLIYYFVWRGAGLVGGSYSLKMPLVFPLVAVVFVYLAIKGISKDDQLLKSIDRIR